MSSQWYMLSVLGKDKPGIVARVSTALYELGCNLGEASMNRLGGNFTIMMMVETDQRQTLEQKLLPVAHDMGLRLHVDPIEGDLHDHRPADVRISVYGADRAGIVAQVTSVLAGAGLDIFDLQSVVAGSDEKPVYIMQIEGHAENGIDTLQQALSAINTDAQKTLQVTIEPVETLLA